MQITNVLEYLDEAALRRPEKAAFCDDRMQLRFADLDMHSRAIGTALTQAGFYAEPVVVFMEKSPLTVAAFFGVLRAGCFYVPLDEDMPRHRIELIFEALEPRAVICSGAGEAALAGLPFTGTLLRCEDLLACPPDEPALETIRRRAIDTDPIYVVFTSGSTGNPKGVTACHRSVVDYIEQLSEVLGFGEGTIFGNQAPLYVDACLKELFPTLKFCATTWFIPKAHFSYPLGLIRFLNEKKINTVCWVASAFAMPAALRILDEITPQYLHTIAFGSEVFPIKQLNAWRAACPRARFFNLYGPTEATGMSCYYELTRPFSEEDKLPIGHPFPNTDVFLLDEQDRLVTAPGQPGELCIRGTCLSLGYYADPERSARSFTQTPLHRRYAEPIYRSGDLACYNPSGELMFLSRKDFQIKRAGYRIELGEIESAALRMDGVDAACCLYDECRKKLLLCYTGALPEAELRELLRQKLPPYMLPSAFLPLAVMPLTPNGKVDRNGLKLRYIG